MEAFPQREDPLKAFPDTTTAKDGGRPSRAPVLVVVGVGLVLLAVALWPQDFSPGETLISPGAKDIAVSTEDTTYPGSDALRFAGEPDVIYVYVRVEDLAEGDLGARVERTAKDSVVGRLTGGGGLRVVDRDEEPLGVSRGGVSGVLKFAVSAESEGPLPAGNYAVEVYNVSDGARRGGVVARKYFVVGD